MGFRNNFRPLIVKPALQTIETLEFKAEGCEIYGAENCWFSYP